MTNNHIIHHGDARAWVETLPPQSVDCIITDPPYDTLDEHRQVGTTTYLKDWFTTLPLSAWWDIVHAAACALKPDGHLYVVTDWRSARAVPSSIDGLFLRKQIIWDKVVLGMGYHYRCRYEVISFYSGKNERRLNDLGIPDVLQVPSLRGSQYYPTAKPPALIETLIRQSTEPGQVVCDPFCGGGSVAAACMSTGRTFWGCDIAEEAVKRTTQVLNSTEQLTLL